MKSKATLRILFLTVLAGLLFSCGPANGVTANTNANNGANSGTGAGQSTSTGNRGNGNASTPP